MKRISVVIILISTLVSASMAQEYTPDEIVIYKNTAQGDLEMHIFYPDDQKEGENRPAIVFFYGGGWRGGNLKQFYQQSEYFAAQGMVAIAVEYRILNNHGTTPHECVKDGKSAIRYVRKHAGELGINPDKIVASGGSAGGHVAATTAIIENYEEGENLDVSSVPDALLLYNPVLDTTKDGAGSDRMGDDKTIISPNHHIRAGLPPSIVFHGTADESVPYVNAVTFQKLMTDNGNLCVLMTSVGQGHSFFNGHYFLERFDNTYFNKVLYESHFFLHEIGILDHLPREWVEGIPESIR